MSLVAAFVYRDGKRVREAAFTSPEQLALAPQEFVWIGLVDPDEAELRTLQSHFDLHALAVEDALQAHQLPKVDVYGDQLFVVTRTVHWEQGQIGYGETDIFIGVSHIITVRHGSARTHTHLREHLEASPALLKHGVDYVLHAVLDYIVDGYLPVVENVEEEVLAMEKRALDAFLSREEVTRIFNLRGELMRLRRILGPMREVVGRLEHMNAPAIHEEVRPYFRDVLDHVKRVSEMVDILRDVLASVFEASTLLEAQRQGVITRRLAAWAAILAVPTAIAGVYGMNFTHMPELSWKYGYFLALGVIGLISGILYVQFRRAKWL